jgi:hypothetical protein
LALFRIYPMNPNLNTRDDATRDPRDVDRRCGEAGRTGGCFTPGSGVAISLQS